MIYRLVRTITDPKTLYEVFRNVDFPRFSDYTLQVDENYFIQRRTSEDEMFYVHFRSGELTKICVYEKEGNK